MKKLRKTIAVAGIILFLFSSGISATQGTQTGTKSAQTKTKSTQPASKTVQTKKKTTTTGSKSAVTKPKSTSSGVKSTQPKSKAPVVVSKPEPPIDKESVAIGTQRWALANLNVSTFSNGDSIPQAKSNKDWVAAGDAGKPAWCYYNNNPAIGAKYGKLYNWYAVNDPRGLAPAGWSLATEEDWSKMANSFGGQGSGMNLKSGTGWSEGNNGTNKSGFNGLPGGYRVENGSFLNVGSIGIWWSTTESKTSSAVDHYLSTTGSLGKSSSPKKRGESVRCIRSHD